MSNVPTDRERLFVKLLNRRRMSLYATVLLHFLRDFGPSCSAASLATLASSLRQLRQLRPPVVSPGRSFMPRQSILHAEDASGVGELHLRIHEKVFNTTDLTHQGKHCPAYQVYCQQRPIDGLILTWSTASCLAESSSVVKKVMTLHSDMLTLHLSQYSAATSVP